MTHFKVFALFALGIVVLIVQGCTILIQKQSVSDLKRPQEYESLFNHIDAAIDNAGVRDASNFPVAHFPYLRTNRFLTNVKDLLNNDLKKEQWVLWMQQLDIEARKKEIQNLPTSVLDQLAFRLGITSNRKILHTKVVLYSNRLLAHDRLQPNFYENLLGAVRDQGEYSIFMRILGLYPITSLPVALTTHTVNREIARWHDLPSDQLDTLGERTIYTPEQGIEFSKQRIRNILERSSQNPLKLPLPLARDKQVLLASFAPILVQDVAATYDKIGEVIWKDDRITVNPHNPTVYHYFSHAFFKGKPVLQMNYVFWFSGRMGPNSPWIERGKLDGITVRVTLSSDGNPVMVDVMT